MSSGIEHLSIKNRLWLPKDSGGAILKPGAQSVASLRATSLALGLVVLVAAVLYINTLGNDFTNWDDGMIYSNYRIRSLDGDALQKIFTYWKGSTYQPVRELSYAIDFYFWKMNPLGYHITNIFFYVLTCLMVFLTLVLPQPVSRWVNIIVAVFFFLFNLLGLPTYPSLYDKFMLAVSLVFNVVTIWYAWKWI